MKPKTKILIILFAITPSLLYANKEVELVNQYGDFLAQFLATDNQRLRESIYGLAPDGDIAEREKCMHCLVDNGMSKILSLDETDGFKGDCQIETYLNKLTLEKHRLKFSHSYPILLKDYKEPVAYTDKKEDTRYFVKMDVSFKGDINYSGTDIFFVQGGKIVKIVDSESSIAKAIQLYSSRKYEEAFRIFRNLAYQSPRNFEAQYYTAVMEIKKQGCHYLGSKVRDMEAAWWITRGKVATSFSWERERLEKLYFKFQVDSDMLPFSNLGRNLFVSLLTTTKFMSEARVPFKDRTGRYGFLNENGEIVVDAKYTFVSPFDPCGLAMVIKDGKVGYIDKGGDVKIPMEYENCMFQWIDGKTFVIKEGKLQIISKDGDTVKVLGEGYDGVCSYFFGKVAFAHNKNSNKWYLHDMNGDILSVEDEVFDIDYGKMCYFQKTAKGRGKEEPFGW